MDDGIGIANISEKLVAEALTFAGAFHKACNIHEFDHRICHFFGLVKLCEKVNPLIGNGNHTHIGLNCAKREVCRLCTCIGDRIKKCGFSDIR